MKRPFAVDYAYCLLFGNHMALLGYIVVTICTITGMYGATDIGLKICVSLFFYFCFTTLALNTLYTYCAFRKMLYKQRRRGRYRYLLHAYEEFGYCGKRGIKLAVKSHRRQLKRKARRRRAFILRRGFSHSVAIAPKKLLRPPPGFLLVF